MTLLGILAGSAFICQSPVVVDGDSLRCAGVGAVRLMAIDAPELPGHCRTGRKCTAGDGKAARAHLRRLVGGKSVGCQPAGRDHYDRLLARCTSGGQDLSCAMVADGFAVERYGRLHCQ